MNGINDVILQKADNMFPNDDLKQNSNQNQTQNQNQTSHTETKTEEEQKQEIDLNQLKSLVYSLKDQLDGVIRVLNKEKAPLASRLDSDVQTLETGDKIIEGVFNGEKMVGADGKEYDVPANYASKSKLVEGDLLKLTIMRNGSFIYKQIGPTERKRLVGQLVSDVETGQWRVLADGKSYKVLMASVTFYKGRTGDETVILVPQDGQSDWAAVENIIK